MVTVAVHWLSAALVSGQFGLGLYMLSLDYYDPNYHALPHYHKSIGILFGLLLLFRLAWTAVGPRPGPAPGVAAWEHRAAGLAQRLLLLGLAAVVVSGYLISTAKGDPVRVFDWFEVPALGAGIKRQEDLAHTLHWWFALGVILLASVHALAALKHHFINRDATLKRMFGKG